jgi:cell division septation protein DedD
VSDHAERKDEKGLSARYLILVFLMGVAACAVFFSLGFLVGYNERPSREAPPAEQVNTTGAIPAPINPPLERVDGSDSPRAPAMGSPSQSSPVLEPRAEAESPAPAPSRSKESPPTSRVQDATPSFAVQVIASRNREDAERIAKELKARGYPVYIQRPVAGRPSDNLFRVQVGPFLTRSEADRVRDKIAAEGFKPFVKR